MAGPAPISPDPQGGQTAVSGGLGFGTSGMPPASGSTFSSSAFDTSGPWYIETQRMSFNYVRHPGSIGRSTLNANAFGLSGTMPFNGNTVSGYPNASIIHGIVAANAKGFSSTDFHNTSAYQQPQRFTIVASNQDLNNADMGTITSGCLGTMGQITTSQRYYKRRLLEYDRVNMSSTDEMYHENLGEGFTFQTSANNSPFDALYDYRGFIMGNYGGWTPWKDLNNLWSLSEMYFGIGGMAPLLYSYGQYSPSQEIVQDTWSVLDRIGDRLGGAYQGGTQLWVHPPPSFGDGLADSLPHYTNTRHDYS